MQRRQFLRAGAAFAATAAHYRALGGASPNERINAGFIGVGGMGTGRLRGFMRHADVNVAALCDVDSNHLARAAELAQRERSSKPELFSDFRKLIERKEIDVVVIATPDHWHTLPAVEACRAGKDVFVEKPLCYSVAEGRAIADAARRHGRITQLGNHIHNDFPNYRRVVELVRSGMLGKIQRVACWKRSAARSIGNPPDGTPPKGLDYEFWLGPAPRHAFNANRCHHTFRYFWDYSGGIFIDFWCHITDVVYWALDLAPPKSVSAVGFRHLPDDNAETPEFFEVTYEHPHDLILTWTVHPRGYPGYEQYDPGCAFQGSEATLVTGYQRHEVYVKGKPVADFKRPDPSIPDSPGHIREFLDAVKSRQPTTCNVEYAHRLTKPGLLGNIAYRTGRRIYWDDARERILGDSQANRMLARKYRKPWKL